MHPRWNPPCICHPIDWSVPFRSLRRGSPSGPELKGKRAAIAAHFSLNTLFHQASPVRLNAVHRNQNSYQLPAPATRPQVRARSPPLAEWRLHFCRTDVLRSGFAVP